MSTVTEAPPSRKALNVALWVVQALLFITFTGGAAWKLLTPLPKIAAMMPWTGQVPYAFFVATALINLAGGIGVLVPALTRIQPGLTVLAALGCAALQVCAIVFHMSRGEGANTPFNFFLVALSIFLAWGRRAVPIQPRA